MGIPLAASFASAIGWLPRSCPACYCQLCRNFVNSTFVWDFGPLGGCPPLLKTGSPSSFHPLSIWNSRLVAAPETRDYRPFLYTHYSGQFSSSFILRSESLGDCFSHVRSALESMFNWATRLVKVSTLSVKSFFCFAYRHRVVEVVVCLMLLVRNLSERNFAYFRVVATKVCSKFWVPRCAPLFCDNFGPVISFD
jgi:hypothetical protein